MGWLRERETVHRVGDAPNMLAILRTAAEIASALLYLHSISILHADLCGTSVLLTSSNKDERGFTAKASESLFVPESVPDFSTKLTLCSISDRHFCHRCKHHKRHPTF